MRSQWLLYATLFSASPLTRFQGTAPATQNAWCEKNILCETFWNFDTLKVNINTFLCIFLLNRSLQSLKNTIFYRSLTCYTNQLPRRIESNKSWCGTILIVAIAVFFSTPRENQYNVRSRRRPKPTSLQLCVENSTDDREVYIARTLASTMAGKFIVGFARC